MTDPTPNNAPVPELSEAEALAEWLYKRGRGMDLGTRDWYFRTSVVLQELAAVNAALATPPPEPGKAMAWMYQGQDDFDGIRWRENWEVTLDEKLARFKSGNKEPIPLFKAHDLAPPPEPPTELQILELSGEIEDAGLGQIDLVRAALERWGRDSRDDDDCISPQDLHDIACSLREGRKGLSKHIVYFQDEGKDKGIGVWAKNEEEAEILAMERYAQIKKARTVLEMWGHR